MKRSINILIAALFPLVICQIAFAWTDSDTVNHYSVVAFKNCEVVSEKTMTAEQSEAYLTLKQLEQEMHSLEMPIQKIEQKIQGYTDKIERLTNLAVQETEGSLHIDKALLKQQEIVVKEFNNFMQLHQPNFDALGKQGSIIGKQAEIFEAGIKASLENVDYDQIRVVTPSHKGSGYSCDNHIKFS
jgi:hypothetical protein